MNFTIYKTVGKIRASEGEIDAKDFIVYGEVDCEMVDGPTTQDRRNRSRKAAIQKFKETIKKRYESTYKRRMTYAYGRIAIIKVAGLELPEVGEVILVDDELVKVERIDTPSFTDERIGVFYR